MTAYIALGSNMGDRAAFIQAALVMLAVEHGVHVQQVSPLHETEPWGYTVQPRFLNAAARIETELEPLELLRACKATEEALGRTPTVRWGPRRIDVDILLYEGVCMHTPELTIPHPHMHERRFVLLPMEQIAPHVVHPTLGKTMRQLLQEL